MEKSRKTGGVTLAAKAPNQPAGLSSAQIENLKRGLRRKTCSEPWVEAQFKTVDDTTPSGRPIVRRFYDPHLYPPGGKRTAMIQCPQCQVFTPPNAFEQNVCLDHADHIGWGPSPSAVAIAALGYFNIRMEETELPPESTRELRREIKAAGKKQPVTAGNKSRLDAIREENAHVADVSIHAQKPEHGGSLITNRSTLPRNTLKPPIRD